jgi:hypothetical protein
VVLAGVAVLAGIAFLAFHPLGEADEWASVGSFVLAGVSLVLSLRPRAADPEGIGRQRPSRSRIRNIRYAQRGHAPSFRSDKPVEVPLSEARPRGDAGWDADNIGVYQEGNNGSISVGRRDYWGGVRSSMARWGGRLKR